MCKRRGNPHKLNSFFFSLWVIRRGLHINNVPKKEIYSYSICGMNINYEVYKFIPKNRKRNVLFLSGHRRFLRA